MGTKLMIAVPCTELMDARFADQLIKLTGKLHRDGIRHEVCIETGTLVYIARNRLACKAINDGFTHVLWLDCDMIFNDEIFDDFQFCGKDIVCGAYVSRRPGYHSCIFKSLKPVERVEQFGNEPVKVAGCGFAGVMTKVVALEQIQNKFGTCFQPTQEFGEDLAFCWRAGQVGIEIWCDPTVRMGHIARIPIWPDEKPAFGAFKEGD